MQFSRIVLEMDVMKKFSLGSATAALTVTLAAFTPSVALATTFSFSFDGVPDGGNQLPGTATGFIFGLDDNGNGQHPTSAEVTSSPQSVSDAFLAFQSGSFDVNNGVITGASSVNFYTNPYVLSFNAFDANIFNDTAPYGSYSYSIVVNRDGFGGVTYAEVSPVPLPASLPMFGVALLALAAFGYGMKCRDQTDTSAMTVA